MKTVIVGGYDDALSITATEYNALSGGYAWTATQANTYQVIPTAGTISKFKVKLSSAVTGSYPFVFHLMVEGAASALTCSVAVGQTQGSDDTHSVSISAGNRVDIRSLYTAGQMPTNTPSASWSVIFEGTDSTESIILGNGYRSTATTHYCGLMPSFTTGTTLPISDVFGHRSRMPTAGSFKSLYACVSVSDPDQLNFQLFKNGVAQNLSSYVASLVCTRELTDTISVADDDYVQMRVIEEGNIAAGYVGWGMVFVPTTAGEFIILHNTSDDPATSEYHGLCNPNSLNSGYIWTNNETTYSKLANAFTAKKIRATIATVPGGTSTRTFCLRKYGSADTALTVDLGPAETSDATTTDVTIADWDRLILKHTVTGTPTATGGTQIGIVGAIATGPTYEVSASDAIKTSEALSGPSTLPVVSADSVKLSETQSSPSILPVALSDAFKVSENTYIPLTLDMELTEGIKLSENVVSTINPMPVSTEGVKVSETLALASALAPVASDAIKVSEVLVSAVTTSPVATDGVKLSEDASTSNPLDLEATDGLKFSEVLTAPSTLPAEAVDAISLYDASALPNPITPTVLGSALFDGGLFDHTYLDGGDQVTKSVTATEGIKVSEALALATALSTLATEGVKLSETVVSLVTIGVLATDGFKISEANTTLPVFDKDLTEGVKVSDAAVLEVTISPALTEGVKIAETIVSTPTISQLLADAFKISESIVLQVVSGGVVYVEVGVADGIYLSETVVKAITLSHTLTEGFKLSDTMELEIDVDQELTDSFKVSELASLIISIAQSLTEGVKFSDFSPLGYVPVYNITVTDGIKLSDALLAPATLPVIAIDGFKLSEQAITGNLYWLVATDGLKFSDSTRYRLPYVSKVPRKDPYYHWGEPMTTHDLGTMEKEYSLGKVKDGS